MGPLGSGGSESPLRGSALSKDVGAGCSRAGGKSLPSHRLPEASADEAASSITTEASGLGMSSKNLLQSEHSSSPTPDSGPLVCQLCPDTSFLYEEYLLKHKDFEHVGVNGYRHRVFYLIEQADHTAGENNACWQPFSFSTVLSAWHSE